MSHLRIAISSGNILPEDAIRSYLIEQVGFQLRKNRVLPSLETTAKDQHATERGILDLLEIAWCMPSSAARFALVDMNAK